MAGVVHYSAYLGSETVYEVKVGDQILKVLRPNSNRDDNGWCADGQPVWLSWSPKAPPFCWHRITKRGMKC